MFGNKPLGGSTVKKPSIRRETVLVPVKRPSSTPSASTASTRPAPPPSSADRLKASAQRSGANGGVKRSSPTASSSASSSSQTKQSKKQKTPVTAQRALAASRGLKRKATPQSPQFSSDEEDDSSEFGASDSDVSRKRMKSSVSSVDSFGPRRDLVLEGSFTKGDSAEEGEDGKADFIHGANATSGDVAAKFKGPWNQESFETVYLQYPTYAQRERFELKWPKNESDDYKPMEDIIETIKQICLFYFPDDLSDKFSNEELGFSRKFSRAWVRQSIPDFIAVVEEFNALLKGLVEDGTTKREFADRKYLPLDIVRRILDQIYARTVSPKVEKLRVYQNGSDNVYGELLPRFCSEIFTKTKLNQESVFVDLGSGVGNVVLQAALEKGCESWGIEMMKNPCDLADLQAKEFPARSRLWGIRSGTVNLLRGDFTENQEIAQVLKRADVVLINNQAFTPALNDKLRDMFLDLKNGCQVVSLKPFVPAGHKMTARNMGSVVNTLIQKKYEYFSDSVSWTDQFGSYYIAVKDPRPYQRFVESLSRR